MKRPIFKKVAFLIAFKNLYPLMAFGEGQWAFHYYLYLVKFFKIFGIWAVGVLIAIKLIDYFKENNLSPLTKINVWLSTGLIALLFWSILIHDHRPYQRPIDTFFKENESSMTNGHDKDSTIVYSYTNHRGKKGVYIWLNGEKHFVRELTAKEEKQKTMNDSLTWEKVDSLKVKTFYKE